MKRGRVRRSLFSVWHFGVFFLLVAFVVSCCFLLFLTDAHLPESLIRERAPRTFLNVVFLSLLFTLLDSLRRKITVEIPVRHILEATEKIKAGDFDVRIKPVHSAPGANELDIIIDNFNKMAEELGSVETLRTDFTASVSHEIKTPLAVIQNYSSLLEKPGLSEEERIEYALAIGSASKRLSSLVSNILKLNRLENQEIFPAAKDYNLSEQLCECFLAFESVWDKKGINIETDIQDNIHIRADAELLSIAWNNLISNALKFTECGGTVKVELEIQNGWAVVTVSNTGCGIGPDAGAHIFEKFYQGDTSHASEGNGLGLALVKRVIDIMGGGISVQSTPGKGSRFSVNLPSAAKKS